VNIVPNTTRLRGHISRMVHYIQQYVISKQMQERLAATVSSYTGQCDM